MSSTQTPRHRDAKLFAQTPTVFIEHPYFTEKPYSRGHAMSDIAAMAAYGEQRS